MARSYASSLRRYYRCCHRYYRRFHYAHYAVVVTAGVTAVLLVLMLSPLLEESVEGHALSVYPTSDA